ncbi:MAG: hypothetical protein HON94_07605 [Methylococcales bacterium]|nr:hypothetical protein [Methylococcales bacterium]MBT7410892.1 hypothetical protein [Methylococcales bacterium]
MIKSIKQFLILSLLAVNSAHASVSEKTIAIFDFDNNSFMDIARVDYLQRVLPEMLLAQLRNIPGIKMIERVQLKAALEELKLGSGDLADKDSQLKLGKILGAKNMMFGSFMAIGNQLRLDVRVIEVETSLTLLSEGQEANIDDLMPTIDNIAKVISNKLGMKGMAKASKGTSQEVWKLFDKGIVLMDKKKYEEAIAIFQQVLEKDPKFDIAEQRIIQSLEKIESQ